MSKPIRIALWLTGAWTTAGTMLFLLWPALTPVLLPLCLIAPVAWYWHSLGRPVFFKVSSVNVIVLVAAGYALANAQWSLARDEAYAYAAMLFVVSACLHIGLGVWTWLAYRPAIDAMAVGFYIGYVLAGCLLCFEILSQHVIFFWLVATFPHLWPQSEKYLSAGALPAYFLNHRMAALAVLFWPVFLTAVQLGKAKWHRALLVAGLMPALLAVAASEHATSLVALVIGVCVAVVGQLSALATRRALMLAWVTACLAVVPLCLAAFAVNLQRMPWLAQSAQDRVVIWKATSDLVSNAPILGIGVHSGRVVSLSETDRKLAPGTPHALSVGWHSHNVFLQVWFEAGAVGAGILLCFGLLVLRHISQQDSAVRAASFATFATCSMIGATGFSAFAPWLVASFAMCGLFGALATAQASGCLPMQTR